MEKSTYHQWPSKDAMSLHSSLDNLYLQYNKKQYIELDPLSTVYQFSKLPDQEIVALIAASLSFGSVRQILKSINYILDAFPEPAKALTDQSETNIRKKLIGFRYRYATETEMSSLLVSASQAIKEFKSLGSCISSLDIPSESTLIPGLTNFVDYLYSFSSAKKNYLLPDPKRGSACKRWFMLLRWMVRKDAVDIGHWNNLGTHRLIVPVDTHMHRIAQGLGLTNRRNADLKTAIEITNAFKALEPNDPVRYDFCLTRLGIRDDCDIEDFLLKMNRV